MLSGRLSDCQDISFTMASVSTLVYNSRTLGNAGCTWMNPLFGKLNNGTVEEDSFLVGSPSCRSIVRPL